MPLAPHSPWRSIPPSPIVEQCLPDVTQGSAIYKTILLIHRAPPGRLCFSSWRLILGKGTAIPTLSGQNPKRHLPSLSPISAVLSIDRCNLFHLTCSTLLTSPRTEPCSSLSQTPTPTSAPDDCGTRPHLQPRKATSGFWLCLKSKLPINTPRILFHGCLHTALMTTCALCPTTLPWGLQSHPTCTGVIAHATLAPASPSAWSTDLLGLLKAGFPSVRSLLQGHLSREVPDHATEQVSFPPPFTLSLVSCLTFFIFHTFHVHLLAGCLRGWVHIPSV